MLRQIILVMILLFTFSLIACNGNNSPEKSKKAKMTSTKNESSGISSSSMGIQKSSVEEININTPGVVYSKKAPGTSNKFERSFENAPPMIPHSLEGLLPITKENNMCLNCHMPETAKAMNATAIPASHFYNIRANKDLKNELNQARFECVLCHVQQATNVKEVVKNKFNPDFRNKESKTSSNLMKNLNEGVKAE